MISTIRTGLTAALLALAAISGSAQEPAFVAGGAVTCLGCHDFGPDSPVHAMLQGSHGASNSPETPMGGVGCEACHGPSADHARTPMQASPQVSYGPRWSSTGAAQDGYCLDCHQDDSAGDWEHALHMVNDLTCVTCHDIHQDADRVMHAATQAGVCTTCHKTQKSGIHGLHQQLDEQPLCTACHNPHDSESALGTMLDNDSAGCRACHDLASMAQDPQASSRAKSYHRVATQPDRSCLDCHQDITHGPADAVSALVTEPQRSRRVALFYPAQSTAQWLHSEHPGSQPLRQGHNCQQCHRGEEPHMASVLGDAIDPQLRHVQVSFDREGTDLQMTLAWDGPANDTTVAVLWGDGGSEAFRRGGCFAACHDDMPGMGQDRGQRVGKYLAASRSQQQRIGQPALLKPVPELTALMQAGDFLELWQVSLNGGDAAAAAAALLAEPVWHHGSKLSVAARHAAGRWTVVLRRPMGSELKPYEPDGKYTLGIALNGAGNPGGKHWVSLPLTLGPGGSYADFLAP